MTKSLFTQKLLKWNKSENDRPMPWKGEKDPYRIWLSEIILQQTRVEQGWAYYEKFIRAFPSVEELARAPEKKVFKLWEGLGYYNRCRNLIETAKKIAKEYNGQFPADYAEIRALKGIGPYTAAAIGSFAFNLPYAVVDGNVERVLARYFGTNTPVDTTTGKKFYTGLAQDLLDKKQAGIYNQAIMDFGAVICKPKNPLCEACVQHPECQAYQNNQVSELPIKKKASGKKNRWFYYFIIHVDGQVYIKQRNAKDIWQGLYEFVLLETSEPIDLENISTHPLFRNIFRRQRALIKEISPIYKQQLTHQTIEGRFIMMHLKKPVASLKDCMLVKSRNISKYPFPRFITSFLEDNPTFR